MTALPDYVMTMNAEDLGELPDGTIISWLSLPGDEESRQVGIIKLNYRGAVLETGGKMRNLSDIPEHAYPVWVVWIGTSVNLDYADTPSPKYSSSVGTLFDVEASPTLRERALELAVQWGSSCDITIESMVSAAERFASFLEGEASAPRS